MKWAAQQRRSVIHHHLRDAQQDDKMSTNDTSSEREFLEWAEPMLELAEREGSGAVFQVLQSEREQYKALIDDLQHLCSESLDGRAPGKTKTQPPESVLKAKAENTLPATTVIKGSRSRKAAVTTTGKTTKHKYFHANVHKPFTVQSDFGEEGKLRIECVDGPSKGQVWIVEPMQEGKRSGEVKIGRSAGKAFKTFGLSLPIDDEISTSHGSIFRRDQVFFYKDMNSSNGTALVLTSDSPSSSIQFEPLKPYQVINGMQAKMGQHTFQFNY